MASTPLPRPDNHHLGPRLACFSRLADKTVVLELGGGLEAGTIDILRTWLSSIVDHGGADVVVDLATVTYIDSTGINELFRAHAHLEFDGRRLTLCGATPTIERLLQISGWPNP